MPLVTTAELVAGAAARDGGVAAFNVITLEHAEGIVSGAQAAGGGVIQQVSENTVAYHGTGRPLSAALLALATEAGVPVSLHLDHVEKAELWEQATAAGYSSVMVDGGALPYDGNVAVTAEATTLLRGQ